MTSCEKKINIEEPVGWKTFAAALQRLNIPQDLVGNPELWSYIQKSTKAHISTTQTTTPSIRAKCSVIKFKKETKIVGNTNFVETKVYQKKIKTKNEERFVSSHLGITMKKKNKKQRGSLQRLSEAYYTPDQPSAYGGINRLQKYTKLKRTAVKNWLSYQDSYTLHKPVRKNFQRRRVTVGGIDHQWQADLIDIQRLKKYNEHYSYLLCVIDVFSKYAWVVPLKNKTGTTLVQAFENIFKQMRKLLKLPTDKGIEYLNRTFQKFLQENNVRFFTTQNEDIKVSIVERFNRIKAK